MDDQVSYEEEKSQIEQAHFSDGREIYDEDEIDLFELLMVLWRQRWVCGGVIISFMLLAYLYLVIVTPRYEITCQVRPGITSYDSKGNPVRSLTPEDIKTYFGKRENWLETLSDPEELGFLKVVAKNRRKASIVDVSLYWPDPVSGTNMLKRLLNYVGGTSFGKVNQEVQLFRKLVEQTIDKTSQAIKHIEIERKRLDDKIAKISSKIIVLKTEMDSIKKDRALTSENLDKLEKQLNVVNKNALDLLNHRREAYKLRSKDVMSLLVYLSVVQQNIAYLNSLENRIANLEKQLTQYDTDLEKKKAEIAQLKITIKDVELQRDKELPMKKKALEKKVETLRSKLEAIQPIEILSPPMASQKPVKPRKKLVVALALVTGFFIGVFLAFVKESWKRNKGRLKDEGTEIG